MKDKKKMRLVVVLAVLLLGGLVYYWFFYTPKLGDYVYVERPNQYSYVVHSKENCSEIKKGVFRDKTSTLVEVLKEENGNVLYCSKCISWDMIEEYSNRIKKQETLQSMVEYDSIAVVDTAAVDSAATDSAATDYEY